MTIQPFLGSEHFYHLPLQPFPQQEKPSIDFKGTKKDTTSAHCKTWMMKKLKHQLPIPVGNTKQKWKQDTFK